MDLRACQKSHKLASLSLAQWTLLSGTWEVVKEISLPGIPSEIRIQLPGGGGGTGHWQILKLPSAARVENHDGVHCRATLALKKGMDLPCQILQPRFWANIANLPGRPSKASCGDCRAHSMPHPLCTDRPHSKASLRQLEMESDLTSPCSPGVMISPLGHVVCAALRSSVKDLLFP